MNFQGHALSEVIFNIHPWSSPLIKYVKYAKYAKLQLLLTSEKWPFHTEPLELLCLHPSEPIASESVVVLIQKRNVK